MAAKKSRKSKKGLRAPHAGRLVSVAERVEQIQGYLDQRAYLEAWKGSQLLWQVDPSDDLCPLVRTCYEKYAEALAHEGRYLKACALVEACRKNVDPVLREGMNAAYVYWLLCAGRYEQALSLLEEHPDWVLPEKQAIIGEKLSVYLLLHPQKHTPLEWFADLEKARAALRDVKVVSRISLRSPFKYWRFLLEAIALFADQRARALALLEKIPETSPYAAVGQVWRMATLPPRGLLENWLALNKPQKALLSAVKGWNPATEEGVEALAQVLSLDSTQQPVRAMRMVSRFVPPAVGQRLCFFVGLQYAERDPEVARALVQRFLGVSSSVGTPFFGPHHWRALVAERRGLFPQALREWDKAVAVLLKDIPLSETVRHVIGFIRLHQSELEEEGDAALQRLLDSLVYWPDRKKTYVTACALCKDKRELYQQTLEQALTRFPKEVSFLWMAAEEARARQAYPQSITWAQRVLEQDALHAGAKRLIGRSEADIVRGLIQSQKYKEALHALQSPRDSSYVFDILLGILQFLTGPVTEALKTFAAVVNEVSFPLMHIMCEAWGVLGVGQLTVIRSLERALKKAFQRTIFPSSVSELLQGMKALQASTEGHPFSPERLGFMQKAWWSIEPLLKSPGSVEECVELSEIFYQWNAFALLRQFSLWAKKHYPHHSAFIYYGTYAGCQGQGKNMSPAQHRILTDVLDDLDRQHPLYARMVELWMDYSCYHRDRHALSHYLSRYLLEAV